MSFITFSSVMMGNALAQDTNVPLTEEEKRWIEENPVIRIANPSTIAPFIFTNENGVEGLAIDYIRLLSSKVGLQIEIPEAKPWNVMMEMLRNGEIDLMHTVIKSADRLEYMSFSAPYIDIPMVDYGRIGGPELNSPEQMNELTIGVIAGFATSDDYMNKFPNGKFIQYDTVREALFALSYGDIDIFTGNLVTINHTVIQNLIPNVEFKNVNKLLDDPSVIQHFAALKENQIIIDIFDKAMQATSNQDFLEISRKWQVDMSLATNDSLGLTTQEQNWIKENPTIRVANPFSIAPFNFVENGEVRGFAADYLRLITARAGLKVEFVEQEHWNPMMEGFRNGELDLIHSAALSEERQEYASFTEPYLEIPLVNVGRIGEKPINSIADLKGKRIALVSGYSTTSDYKNLYPELDLIEYGTIQEALRAVSSNQADIYTGNMITINFTILQSFIPNLQIIGENKFLNIKIVDHRFAALHENSILIDILQKSMDTVPTSEFLEISQRWQEMGLNTNLSIIDLTFEEIEWIKNNPIVTVTNPSGSAPFSYTENGNMMGIAIDYLDLISQSTGLEFQYAEEIPWNEMFQRFRSGEIDLIHSANKNDERQKYIEFTDSYLQMQNVIMGRTNSLDIDTPEELEGKTIGLVKGYILSEAYVEKLPDNEFIEFDNILDALRALSASEVDVVPGNLVFLNYIIEKNFIPGLRVIGKDMIMGNPTINHHFGTLKEKKILSSIINKALNHLTDNEIRQISSKWRTTIENESRVDIGLTNAEKEWLADNPVVRLAFEPNLPPLIFINDNGEIDGMGADYLEIMEQRLGIDFQWVGNQTLEEGLNMIRSGSADAVPILAETAARNEYLTFTSSINSVSHMIFSRQGGEIYSNMAALSGKTIAQVKDFDITDMIKRDYPNINVIEVDSIVDA
ncbi:transporter substrate-binding domain-containing protein [Pseudemcibacter aquimaris]|uniref:transporter substrate-binding domain-containing protein n=1 Tax=Pseudemcibacter aquimaris TaxID=2857064 RepID=UPI003B83020C|nr:transporter substrate-binding domain-containing protein [Pseudemcibacter aquimaris]